jgi:hypothetical protein
MNGRREPPTVWRLLQAASGDALALPAYLRLAIAIRPSKPEPNNQTAAGIGMTVPSVPNENRMESTVVASVTPVAAMLNVTV